MNSRTMARLERLEHLAPGELIIEYNKGSETVRNTMKEFCRECRAAGVIYSFRVVDGNKMQDIDMLISLIDDQAKEIL